MATLPLLRCTVDRDEALANQLLPAVCANRYHVAEGVRGTCQTAWQAAVGASGPRWVAQHMTQASTPSSRGPFNRLVRSNQIAHPGLHWPPVCIRHNKQRHVNIH